MLGIGLLPALAAEPPATPTRVADLRGRLLAWFRSLPPPLDRVYIEQP